MKNALAGTSLPRINPFVDAYNAVSLAHVLPAGADDLDRVAGDLAFRFSREGDDFRDMGALDESGAPLADPPKPGEVVYADSKKILCRRWNWRQDARSAISPETRRAVVTLAGERRRRRQAGGGRSSGHSRRRMRRTLRVDGS